MSTSSTSFQLKIPATYPYNQYSGAEAANVSTDTETQPSVSTPSRSVFIPPAPWSPEKRNIQVQTKVFRTDQDSGATNFQSCYITVPKSAL